MMRGAGEWNHQGLRDQLNRIETEMRVGGAVGFVRASLKTTRENLEAAIALLGHVMRSPALPAEELAIIRKERLANLERMRTDPQGLVFSELGRSLSPYAKEDVRYQPSMEEQIERLEAVQVEDVRALHARFLAATELRVAVVGDFDEDAIVDLIEETFGDWTSEEPYERIAQEVLSLTAKDETIDTPDKQMAIVVRGTVFPMRDDDPAYPALRFANFVFGESTTSRLMNALRHEGGLSYSVGSMLSVDDEVPFGRLLAFAICAPQNATEAQRVLRAEFDRWFEEGLDEEEIDEARKGYLEQFKTQLANDNYLVQRLLSDLRTGRNFRYQERVVAAVNDLDRDQLLAALQTVAGSTFVDFVGGDVAKFSAE